MINSMSIISKSGTLRFSIPSLIRAFSTTGENTSAGNKEPEDPNRILVQKPVKAVGQSQNFWSWLKVYIKHTIRACRLSFHDGQYFIKHRKNPNLTLSEIVRMREIKNNLRKLIPFSFFIVVPFAEFLIPVYLVLYQKGIPTRFLTQKGIDKTNYRMSMLMLDSQNKLKTLLPEGMKKLKDLDFEEQQAITLMINWLENGFNYNKDSEYLSKASPVFEKHVRPLINSDGKLLREYMFAIGLLQVTGLYYFNSLFKLANLGPVTLASPCIRSIFKFYPRIRINMKLKAVNEVDNNITDEGIDGLTSNQTVDLATQRAIIPLKKTELELKNDLKKWHKQRELRFSTFFMTFLNICEKYTQ